MMKIWPALATRCKRLSVLAAALVMCLTAWSANIDSLYLVYLNAMPPFQVKAANELLAALDRQGVTDTLYRYPDKANRQEVALLTHYWMSEYYYGEACYEESLQAATRAGQLLGSTRDKRLKSDVLATLGNAHFRAGNYDQALKTQLQAYEIDKQLDEQDLISSDLNSIAATYLAVQQPGPGIAYIERAIVIERKLGRQDRLAIRLGMASELYLMNNEPTKAMKAITEAYRIDSLGGREEKAAVRLSQKAAILEANSLHDQAMSTVMRAISVLEGTSNTYSLAVCYNQLAGLYGQQGDRRQAITYYQKALEQSIKCGAPKVERQAEKGLWESLRDDNPGAAMIHLERYAALTDSMHAHLTLAQAGVMAITAQNRSTAEINQQRHGMKNLFTWGIVAMTLVMAVLLTALAMAWRKNRAALEVQKQTQEIRSHFFTNVTRELHSPLTVILAAGDKLLESAKPSLSQNKQLGSIIANNGNRMLELINRILDIETVSASKVWPKQQTGDIVLFCRLLVENFTQQAGDKGVKLQFTSPLRSMNVKFASGHLRDIIHCLIANAIKFTPGGGTVSLELSPIDNKKMRLTIADTGIGIPVQDRPHIFEPLSNSALTLEGSALTTADLALVKQLVLDMRGTINVSTTQGQGSVFIIDFPARRMPSGNPQLPTRKPLLDSSRHNLRQLVFIVDNDEDFALITAGHLGSKYEVRIANDGQEAFHNISSLVPDLIVTSLSLPSMNGRELIKKVRSARALSHIPIIAMATTLSEKERINCIKNGADYVLVKPFDSTEFKLVVERLVGLRTALRDLYLKDGESIKEGKPMKKLDKEDKQFLSRFIKVIHAQMAKENFDMENVAAAMSISPRQLRVRIMDITGVAPVAYALQLRLKYARHLMAHDDASVSEVARRCGFQSQSHFSNAFKQQFGLSPLQYRKSVKDSP